MTALGNSGSKRQVVPVDYEAVVSQRLVDASHTNDLESALECIVDPFVNVNFIGTVCLKARKTELVLGDEAATQVRIEFEEFRTEVTALFLAAHAGNVTLVLKLLSAGANANHKLFRGYATTAAVREDHIEILEILLNGEATQPACEEALLEACYVGRARFAELLLGSELISPHVAVHALVTASYRGFVDVVETLIKCGVDPNANARVLLRSSKPSLHTNVDCNALVAAIVSRQISVVKLLLQAGVGMDIKARLGAWSWDMDTGEEFRVGAGLAEPYSVTWCAVEYFESTGSILRMLLHHVSPNIPHLGRTIIHHAILCNNARAVDVLLDCHSDMEFPVQTTGEKIEFRPIHLASRLGSDKILQQLIDGGCNLDSKTESGETALMICARYKQEDCLKLLASGSADFGLVNSSDHSVESICGFSKWNLGFQQAVLDIIHSGKLPYSSNLLVFSPLLFVTRSNDIKALTKLVEKSETKIDEQDGDGFSAVMIAAAAGNVEAFRLLVFAGADVNLHNKYNETAIALSEANKNVDVFEKVILDYALEKGSRESTGFYPMHRGASRGDIESVGLLTTRGYDVNVINGDGFTPLMLAARGGHRSTCELLISGGAKCDTANSRLETALKLTRKNGVGNDAEGVILDEIARKLVLGGGLVKKHTKEGKGCPHRKVLKMVGGTGLLRWGKSRDRNVICKEAEVGPSSAFRRNRRRMNSDEPGLFRVVTAVKNKEVHFVCDGGSEMAELWVRGIQLVTREAIFGKKQEE